MPRRYNNQEIATQIINPESTRGATHPQSLHWPLVTFLNMLSKPNRICEASDSHLASLTKRAASVTSPHNKPIRKRVGPFGAQETRIHRWRCARASCAEVVGNHLAQIGGKSAWRLHALIWRNVVVTIDSFLVWKLFLIASHPLTIDRIKIHILFGMSRERSPLNYLSDTPFIPYFFVSFLNY